MLTNMLFKRKRLKFIHFNSIFIILKCAIIAHRSLLITAQNHNPHRKKQKSPFLDSSGMKFKKIQLLLTFFSLTF